jgi:flagellar motility protein MotE (MotC chaperone)
MTRKTKGVSRRPRGLLWFLAGLLCISGAIRLGLGFQEARALVPSEPAAPPQIAASCPPAPAEVLAALQSRESRLAEQEAAFSARMSALENAETTIKARLDELRAAEAALSETLARSDGAAEGDLSRLTAVYEAMKPKDAATLFETMAPDFAAGFLGRMRPEAAAGILSGMTPEAAYTISVLLAGRNALVPTE